MGRRERAAGEAWLMLSFRRLMIEDFGPYRGRQVMEFPRGHGIYIVYGPNGRGKTKLQNAFRWALYGEILGRRGAQSAAELVNSEARRAAGYGSFMTILEFSNDGVEYRLTRRYDEREQSNVSALLEKDNVPLSQVDTEKLLQQIAPSSVSQFFLFDGELLRQYESLLDKDSDQGKYLEEAIEKVLGIPIVANALSDAEELRTKARRRLAEQASANAQTQQLGAALAEAEDVRAELVRDRRAIKEAVDNTESRIAEIEQSLREQPRAERLLGQLDQMRQRASELRTQKEVAERELAELSGELWKAVLSEPARIRVAQIRAQVDRIDGELRLASAALRDRDHLEAHENCPVCERDLSSDERDVILQGVTRRASFERRAELDAEMTRARGHLEVLADIAAYDGRLVRERDRALRQVKLGLSGAIEDLGLIESQLGEVDEDAIRSLSKERDERKIELSRHRERLEKAAKDIQNQDASIEELNSYLAKQHFTPDATVGLKQRVTEDLVGLFSQSIEAYRRQLKDRVEGSASQNFARIASEEDYAGLRITDRYGLEIIDRENEVVTGRSAGYEHLVALSLIAALQHSAAVRGPVLMDSPFGRLDRDHTRNVVAALPRMADQVVLFAFDGEFDRETALRSLGSDLVAEFELERISTRHTKLKLRGAV
ncbi:AAA family ATPase [Streptomyces sp. NPDC058659]|uniref:AAA family ATPase n=1 Tax=unclassified Streptomyces TaxID=2593676 RepID=UPI003654B068